MGTAAAPSQEIAFALPHTAAPATLTVRSPAFGAGQPIPEGNSAYSSSFPPEIAWENIPEAAQSLVLLCEDPDAPNPKPFVHWILYDIPARASNTLSAAGTAREGTNSKGQKGYFGPRPPLNDPPHHYHFEVFALDIMPPLPEGAERQAVLECLAGHVLAKGELVGTFAAPRRAA